MYKVMNGLVPAYLQDLIPDRVQARTRYNLRNRNESQVPMARLESYSQSFFAASTRTWNQLKEETKESPSAKSFKYHYLKEFPRPIPNPLFYRGLRIPAVHHARMRIRCSGLNADLHNELHVVDSSMCTCQLAEEETAEHYFCRCPRYTNQRQVMLDKLNQKGFVNPSVKTFLCGDESRTLSENTDLFVSIHKYILATKHFTD
jgi:hypothetical protein